MTEEERIADYVSRYGDLFAAQVERAGGWPVSFIFPEPNNRYEQQALNLFLAEVEKATGVTVQFTFKPCQPER